MLARQPAQCCGELRDRMNNKQAPTRTRSSITGAQLDAARQLLGWTQRELADRCAVSRGSISRLLLCPEWPLRARPETIAAIERVLDEGGIEFTTDGTAVMKGQA